MAVCSLLSLVVIGRVAIVIRRHFLIWHEHLSRRTFTLMMMMLIMDLRVWMPSCQSKSSHRYPSSSSVNRYEPFLQSGNDTNKNTSGSVNINTNANMNMSVRCRSLSLRRTKGYYCMVQQNANNWDWNSFGPWFLRTKMLMQSSQYSGIGSIRSDNSCSDDENENENKMDRWWLVR